MITAATFNYIKDFGFLEYDAKELYNYIKDNDPQSFASLGMSLEQFEEAFNNPLSIVFNTYQYFPTIKKCGALEYSPARIAKILMLDEETFQQILADPTSRERKKYDQGMLESQFRIDSALAADAEAGNKEAIKLLESRRKRKIIQDFKLKTFGIDAGSY